MTGWLWTILYLCALPVAGWYPARMALRGAAPLRAEFWLPLAFLFGIGLQCFAFLLSMLVFGKVFISVFLALAAGLAGGGAWLAARGGLPEFQGFSGFSGPSRSVLLTTLGLILLVWVVLYANAASYPFTSYDGRAIWSFKAKILLHEGTVFTPAFTDPLRVHYHRDYPLLVPFGEYVIYAINGFVAERQARFLFSTFFVFQVLFFGGALRRLGAPGWLAVMVALLYCATPFRDDWAERDGGALNSGAADIPLSFLAMGSAVGYLLFWRERQRWQWLLGGIMGGFALMTKAEGMVVVAAMLGANLLMALLHRREVRRAWMVSLGGFALSLFVALPWFLVKARLPNYYDESYSTFLTAKDFPATFQRLPLILSTLLGDLFRLEKWNGLWVAYLLALPVAALGWVRSRRRDVFLDAVIVLWFSAYVFVYMVSPLDLNFHLNTSISRLLSHFLPLALLRVGVSVADRWPDALKADGPPQTAALESTL